MTNSGRDCETGRAAMAMVFNNTASTKAATGKTSTPEVRVPADSGARSTRYVLPYLRTILRIHSFTTRNHMSN
ncbi:uncharacterized protein RAG0_01531 [Rhynchosporium agropyri]|uniref:Uncharacterized protein n=2 Tax=Rhynchosporium TaxID=38037 RepID=A0A1E1JXJ9_9HELO|nr:uncharacterized protein RAG0_01531 [Rhynchosporium agropyri]